MIGLGSNRLTVCRRGGMSVTQAGRGGMEWLAGVRYPDWATPYSAQATAALKAQFPTQWPTIRDYGFAHPEIVGYMNAYAPEDAKIAYSLVEGIGERWVAGDGYAYIDTGYKAIADTSMDIQFLWPGSINTRYASLIECDGGGLEYGVNHWNSFYWNYGGYMSFSGIAANTKFYIETRRNVLTLYKNGSVVTTATRPERTGTTTTNGTLPLFAWRRSGSVMTDYITNAHIWFLRFYEGETLLHYYIPFKRTGGECGMIDLITGTFHGNVRGHGSFTISETPAS